LKSGTINNTFFSLTNKNALIFFKSIHTLIKDYCLIFSMLRRVKKLINLPNFLTMLRLLLIIPFVFFTIKEDFFSAIIVMLLMFVTELDGTIARALKIESEFGEAFDFIIDEIVSLVIFLALFYARNYLNITTISWMISNLVLTLMLLSTYKRSEKLHKVSKMNKIVGASIQLVFIALLFNIHDLFILSFYFSFFAIISLGITILITVFNERK